MKKLLLVALLSTAFAAGAFADIPTPTAVQEAITPHSSGGATGFCSIVYYNICSGWIWIYSGWALGDEPGIAFDLFVVFGTTMMTQVLVEVSTGGSGEE